MHSNKALLLLSRHLRQDSLFCSYISDYALMLSEVFVAGLIKVMALTVRGPLCYGSGGQFCYFLSYVESVIFCLTSCVL